MDEQKINNLIQQGIETYMRNKQFNYSKIPAHEHTGIDTMKIQENNLIPSNQYSLNWVSTSTETFTLSGISNFTNLTFYGVATNGAFGGGPYDEKATIQGEAKIAPVFPINSVRNSTDYYANGSFLASDRVTPVNNQYYQACTSTYLNAADSTKLFVTASADSFAIVDNNGTGGTGANIVVKGQITNVTNDKITITITLTANWYLRGYFFLS